MVDFSLAPSALRTGLRVYAVGDVHGCRDQLAALHQIIAVDLAARPASESTLIHLGDYVDRGPDSAGVIELLCNTVAPRVTRRIDLKGNHEAMMLGALSGDTELAETWMDNGGAATVESYGLTIETTSEDWRLAVPLAHTQWIKNLELTHQVGGYLFVHAGIRPGRPLFRQTTQDLLWIREPFLSSLERHPYVVVHGHTPAGTPDIRPNRIGIDTGAVMGGALTCLVLEGDRMGFLTV